MANVKRTLIYLDKNEFARKIKNNYTYRTHLTAYISTLISIVFAVYNAILGIAYNSVWFGALAVYYIIICIMRIRLVNYKRLQSRKNKRIYRLHEWKLYRNTGVLFILLTIAMIAAVFQMVCFDKGKSYSGTMIYVVALYAFYKMILSIINMVKAGKRNSPIIQSIRNIGYADALVSMLSLQTAMFASFGSTDLHFKLLMNSIVGTVFCLMTFFIGIRMTIKGTLMKNKHKPNKS